MVSSRSWVSRNSGRIREMISVTMTARVGIATSSRPESGTSSRRARMTPPIAMIGADTNNVSVIRASI